MSAQPERARSDIAPRDGMSCVGLPFETLIRAHEIAIRDGLRDVLTHLMQFALSSDTLVAVELVLAEVLNNIVEHAYADQKDGTISMSVTVLKGQIMFQTIDTGKQMPHLSPPDPSLPDLDGCHDALPEGNFGWFIIRQITSDIGYMRDADRNILEFTVAA